MFILNWIQVYGSYEMTGNIMNKNTCVFQSQTSKKQCGKDQQTRLNGTIIRLDCLNQHINNNYEFRIFIFLS